MSAPRDMSWLAFDIGTKHAWSPDNNGCREHGTTDDDPATLRTFKARLEARGKKKMQANVAVMRKMLSWMSCVATRPWSPDHVNGGRDGIADEDVRGPWDGSRTADVLVRMMLRRTGSIMKSLGPYDYARLYAGPENA